MSCFEIIQLNNIRLILKTTPRPLRLLSAHWDHCDRSLGGKGGHDESIVIFSFEFFVDVNFDINFQNGAAEAARCCPQPNFYRPRKAAPFRKFIWFHQDAIRRIYGQSDVGPYTSVLNSPHTPLRVLAKSFSKRAAPETGTINRPNKYFIIIYV